MAATTRPQRAPAFISRKLVVLLLVVTAIRGPITRISQDYHYANRFHLGQNLAAPKVPKDPTGLQSHRESSSSTRVKALNILRTIHYCSIASLMVLLSGDVCPNPGWCHANLNTPGLKIGHLNIRSLPKHIDELKILLLDNPFHIMCLNETWLNSSWTDSELHIEGYNLIRNDRPDSQRGGTAIYFSKELMGRHRPDLNSSELEAVWLEVLSPNKSRTLICSIYQPPDTGLDDFKTNIEGVMDKVSMESASVILTGDLNIDMKGKHLTTQAKGLNQLFNIYQLKQLIKEPTRMTEWTSSLIDLVYASEEEKIVTCGVYNCAISDHSLVYLVRRSKKPRAGRKFIRYRCYKTTHLRSFVLICISPPGTRLTHLSL